MAKNKIAILWCILPSRASLSESTHNIPLALSTQLKHAEQNENELPLEELNKYNKAQKKQVCCIEPAFYNLEHLSQKRVNQLHIDFFNATLNILIIYLIVFIGK